MENEHTSVEETKQLAELPIRSTGRIMRSGRYMLLYDVEVAQNGDISASLLNKDTLKPTTLRKLIVEVVEIKVLTDQSAEPVPMKCLRILQVLPTQPRVAEGRKEVVRTFRLYSPCQDAMEETHIRTRDYIFVKTTDS